MAEWELKFKRPNYLHSSVLGKATIDEKARRQSIMMKLGQDKKDSVSMRGGEGVNPMSQQRSDKAKRTDKSASS